MEDRRSSISRFCLLHRYRINTSVTIFRSPSIHFEPSNTPQYRKRASFINAMPTHWGFEFTPQYEDLLIAAFRYQVPKLSTSEIASMFQLLDWARFRSFKEHHALQVYHETSAKQFAPPTNNYWRNILHSHQKAVHEFDYLVRWKVTQKAINLIVYGYRRTRFSTMEIAEVMNKEELGLTDPGLNPIDPIMVERIHDWVTNFNPFGCVMVWTNTASDDPELLEVEAAFRDKLGLDPSTPITVPATSRNQWGLQGPVF
ncbi:MAG: hypothetical protein Q9169_008018 [Polycauliona sp. 2 TL-2023]